MAEISKTNKYASFTFRYIIPFCIFLPLILCSLGFDLFEFLGVQEASNTEIRYSFNILFFLLVFSSLFSLVRIIRGTGRWGWLSIYFLSVIPLSFISLFSVLYYKFGIISGEKCILWDCSKSIYFSIVTWSTLGYGDLHPANKIELFAATEGYLGYLFSGVLIGILFKLIQGWEKKHHFE